MDQRRGNSRSDDIEDDADGASVITRPISIGHDTDVQVADEKHGGEQHAGDARWRRFELLSASPVPLSAAPQASRSEQPSVPITGRAPVLSAVEVARPARSPARGAWRLRLEGAAVATLAALALAVAGAFYAPAPPLPQTAALAPLGPAPIASPSPTPSPTPERFENLPPPQPDAGAFSGLSESAIIALISTAEPPFRVVMHLAPEASPREVARLETAVRAWGFAPPEQRPAQEPLVLPEVAFHHEEDRDAALLLARIADGILPIAVLTPPQTSGGADAALPSRGTLDLMVVTR